ncbi:MAG: tagaturonate reductase [Chloroflexota bacterium]|nr:tagaturonate reductase [Chloroflexota bacterium]MDE2907756.1 tagaturonate reductase [Chloroflexota bacterium]
MIPRLSNRLHPDRQRYAERIVQFGGGNFLRGFVDWVVDILNGETDFGSGIVIVKATPGTYDALDEQDCLFTTYLHGVRDGAVVEETRLISAVERTVYPYQDFGAYLALARQPEVRFIFSNTTESGIVFSADDALDDEPPAMFPAKLTRFLYERFRHFAGAPERGCIIIPTELIVDNATRLREFILEYAALWRLEPGFSEWLEAHNTFCNTLVDRIVSGFPQAEAERLYAELGYDDRLLAAGEIYHSWIIEAEPRLLDEFPVDKTRTPLNVNVVDDAAPYRAIKVRLLNGAHTSLVPLGLLLGLESVREAMEHEALAAFISELIFQEVIPSVTEAPSDELEAFARDVFDRFRNPHIHHRLLTIALNSSAKVKERILPSLLGYCALKGELPERLVIAFAAFIRLYRGEWRGEPIPLNDDPVALAWFKAQWTEADSTDDLVQRVLSNTALWERDLTAVPGLAPKVGACLQAIEAGELLPLIRRHSA